MPVVTLSASYGAGGSEIGPRVAQRLGLPFLDRAIPVAVAQDFGISVDEAEAVSQNAQSPWWNSFARMSTLAVGLVPLAEAQGMNEREFVEQTEAHIREVAAAGGCVILGHAAAVVLADHPDALHVRLDGSVAGRIAAAARRNDLDEAAAAAAQRKNDKIRSGYVRHFYRVDSADPACYDLVIDTVRLGRQWAEQLILEAVRLMDDDVAEQPSPDR